MSRRFGRTWLRLLVTLALTAAPLASQIPQAEYARRRAALAARMGDGALLVLGAREPAEDYQSFVQTPRMEYLTGFREPNAALVIVRKGADVTSMLFVEPREPAREVWTGTRAGPLGAAEATGLATRTAPELQHALDSLGSVVSTLYVVANAGSRDDEGTPMTLDDQFVRALERRRPALKITPFNREVDKLRGTKSDAELALIQRSAAITVEAQRVAMRAIRPGMNEFEIQAMIEYTFRRRGADRPSFATIVGSGPNSTTLHYNRNDRVMNAGEVVVMDIGSSYQGYSADVTRTVPVSGTFSAEQRALYQLVRDAQAAAEAKAKPGVRAAELSRAATEVAAAGLAKLGLIEAPDATYECSEDGKRLCPQYALYYLHGLSHGIGLEVHDPDQSYFTGTLAAGSAVTIEPGVYVRENLLEILPKTARNAAMLAAIRPAVERYRGTGVRIEDDYLVTAAGVEWISRAPREVSEVESAMRGSRVVEAPVP